MVYVFIFSLVFVNDIVYKNMNLLLVFAHTIFFIGMHQLYNYARRNMPKTTMRKIEIIMDSVIVYGAVAGSLVGVVGSVPIAVSSSYQDQKNFSKTFYDNFKIVGAGMIGGGLCGFFAFLWLPIAIPALIITSGVHTTSIFSQKQINKKKIKTD